MGNVPAGKPGADIKFADGTRTDRLGAAAAGKDQLFSANATSFADPLEHGDRRRAQWNGMIVTRIALLRPAQFHAPGRHGPQACVEIHFCPNHPAHRV